VYRYDTQLFAWEFILTIIYLIVFFHRTIQN